MTHHPRKVWPPEIDYDLEDTDDYAAEMGPEALGRGEAIAAAHDLDGPGLDRLMDAVRGVE